MKTDVRQQPETPKMFKLDQLCLDEALKEHAELVYQWGRRAEEARRRLDEARLELEETEASVNIQIRKNPANFGLDKVTESAIASMVILDVKVSTAKRKVLRLKYRLGKLQVIMHGLDDRKKALEYLCQLWSQSYFAEPKLPEDSKKLIDKMEDKRLFGKKRVTT